MPVGLYEVTIPAPIKEKKSFLIECSYFSNFFYIFINMLNIYMVLCHDLLCHITRTCVLTFIFFFLSNLLCPLYRDLMLTLLLPHWSHPERTFLPRYPHNILILSMRKNSESPIVHFKLLYMFADKNRTAQRSRMISIVLLLLLPCSCIYF